MENKKSKINWDPICQDIALEIGTRRFLKSIIYDECHLRADFLSTIKWVSIHAENSGELDDELKFIEIFLKEREIEN